MEKLQNVCRIIDKRKYSWIEPLKLDDEILFGLIFFEENQSDKE